MAKTTAERQADHRKRLRETGKVQKLITIDETDWQAGFDAGLVGAKNYPPPKEIQDDLAWYSGYIEGKAKKLKLDAEALRNHKEVQK
jgi:hypothetical protein